MAVSKRRVSSYITDDELIVDVYDYVCTSEDEKPTEGVAVNAFLVETDTGTVYTFNGEGWDPFGGA